MSFIHARTEASSMTSMEFVNIEESQLGVTHPVWTGHPESNSEGPAVDKKDTRFPHQEQLECA